jgi:16S rRNA (cytosine1402-N4)-methyltransferase
VGEVLADLHRSNVDGFVLDLGPSSPQLDRPERGFSFSRPGPIDMRMDPGDPITALDVIRESATDELAAILADFGEERYASRVAGRLKQAARQDQLHTTADVAAVVTDSIPAKSRRTMRIHPATRVFQALRIAVNRELEQLTRFLAIFPDLLAPGGRCVVISFHSLEDRLVKHRFRALAHTSSLPPEYAVLAGEPVRPTCLVVTRKAVVPTDDEVDRNPRARSARLRACEKVSS